MSTTGKQGSKRCLNQEMHSISRCFWAEFDIIDFLEDAQSEVGGNVFVFLGKLRMHGKCLNTMFL